MFTIKNIVVLFVLSTFFISNAQQNLEIDSLKNSIVTLENDSIIMEIYNKLRRATYYSNPKESRKYAVLYLEYAKKIKNIDKVAVAHYHLGNALVTHAEFDNAINHYLKATEFYEQAGDSLRLSSVFNGIGAAYENNGNDTLSLKYFTMSYNISKSRGDRRRTGIAANNISNIHKSRGDLDKAIGYLKEASDNLNQPAYIQYYIPISINLANAYSDVKRWDAAADIYNRMLVAVDSINDIYSYAAILRGLGNLELQKGNDVEALSLLKSAFQKYTNSGFIDERYDTMKDLIDAYQANGFNNEALLLFYEYNTIKDSIFTTEKDKNLTEALQKYESSKKEKKIIAQQLTIERKNKQKQIMSISLLGLGIISLLGFIFYRKRLKYQHKISEQTKILQNQKIIELEQENILVAFGSMIEGQEKERLRIAKDLHDSLGGLLSTIKSHFSTIQKNNEQITKQQLTTKTNSLIDEACVEVRRISHNMMPNALNLSGLQGALEDLGEYLTTQGFNTTVEISNLGTDIKDTTKVMIYRLIQEIVSNIRKHAQAKKILIQLIKFKNELHLTIEDDGVGFDYESALRKKSLGLKSINSRVAYLKGIINWDTQKGKGTTINITIPLL
jgi:signal transduction histidine kinase